MSGVAIRQTVSAESGLGLDWPDSGRLSWRLDSVDNAYEICSGSTNSGDTVPRICGYSCAGRRKLFHEFDSPSGRATTTAGNSVTSGHRICGQHQKKVRQTHRVCSSRPLIPLAVRSLASVSSGERHKRREQNTGKRRNRHAPNTAATRGSGAFLRIHASETDENSAL